MTDQRLPGMGVGTLGDTCTVRDVRELWGLDAPTVRGLCRSQIIIARKKGGMWRIDTDSARRILEAH